MMSDGFGVTPKNAKFLAHAGDTIETRFTYKKIDLSAALFQITFKRRRTDATPKVALSSLNLGGIMVELVAPVAPEILPNTRLTVLLSPLQTRLLEGAGVWDLQVTFPNGRVETHIDGEYRFGLDVTRQAAVE